MKKTILIFFSIFIGTASTGQKMTWSPTIIEPKGKNLFTGLSFPGRDASYYYVNESFGGGVSINRKTKDYIKVIDKSSMAFVKEIELSEEVKGEGKEYYNTANFILNNKRFSFFTDRAEKDIFNVYATVQKFDEKVSGEIKQIQQVDISKARPFASSASPLADKMNKNETNYRVSSYVNIKPAFDRSGIISALITKSVDKDYSMLNISEWDENLKQRVSNDYKIPFHARQNKQKTIFGSVGTSSGILPRVLDFVKDDNGFVYVLIQSANPKDEDDAGTFWFYQFKTSDPGYVKVYRKEIMKNIATVQAELFQDAAGKVYVSNIGLEITEEKDRNERYYVNSAFIGAFSSTGILETIFSKQLSTEMMYNFESEKTVDKAGHINSLRIKNILPAPDGGTYVIWQHEWQEYKQTTSGGSNAYYNFDNVLVQYFGKTKKMIWERPIYKRQVQKSGLSDSYSGIYSFTQNGNIYIVYPDDIKNSNKAIDDRNVSQFSVVKFGDKDLAGMFVAKINAGGTLSKKYINWPEDKIGFALNLSSLTPVENNLIGTVRKLHQGVIALKSEEYTFFKLDL